MRQWTFLFTALLAGWLSLSPAGAAAERPERSGTLPVRMLWAWERPTDLRGLETGVGVAFYAQTLSIEPGRITVAPRRNPLRVDERTTLVAVTRIESDAAGAVGMPDASIDAIAEAIAGTARLPRVSGVQIDFDAAASERGVYRRLIVATRVRLGAGVPLSMTALASWCAGDAWLDGLPVDEVVPMLFRMGPINHPYASIGTAPVTAAPACRAAIGLSLDEPVYARRHGRRVYVFNPGPWTAANITQAREVLE